MIRQSEFPFLPKDFIQTSQGLIFAVVSYHPHRQKVGCFLRYVHTESGWQKVDTEQANRLLERHYPHYLYRSEQFGASFHAVDLNEIVHHYHPEQRLQQIMLAEPVDEIEGKLHKLVAILRRYDVQCNDLGLTGSILIGQQQSTSDIDLVVYGRKAYHRTRAAVKQAVADKFLAPLDDTLMRDNFERRGSDLGFDEFAWHESRKFNKAVIDGTKFDIGMVCLSDELEIDHRHYIKQGVTRIRAKVLDDLYAFDFPAQYVIDNPQVREVVCFTHTYVGQAQKGEMIEVSGTLEADSVSGQHRLVVGSTREATGEYIKVCQRRKMKAEMHNKSDIS